MLYDPVEIGYVRRGGPPELPAIASLGRSDGALAFLRFSVPLPPDAGVVEAYLLLDRVTEDSDPEPIELHVARVVDPWDGRSLSWAVQPRVEEVGSPVTRVLPASGPLVRIDVRSIVERWRRRRRSDFGLAIVSDAPSGEGPVASSRRLGVAFALAPRGTLESGPPGTYGASGQPQASLESGGAARAPRLELYVR